MNRFIEPNAINILGGKQSPARPQDQASKQGQSAPKQSKWEKFKRGVKGVWDTVMTVAKGICDNIMPIITGIGTVLNGWAAFCKRTQKRESQRGYCRCAV